MDDEIFKTTNFDIQTYINETFKDSSEPEILKAIKILQTSISRLQSESKSLVKEHFSKYVECNNVLESIKKDMSRRPTTNNILKHNIEVIKRELENITFFEYEDIVENEDEIRNELRKNFNSFSKFVEIWKNIDDVKKYEKEKIIFLEFLIKKAEEEKDLQEQIRLLKMCFDVDEDNYKDKKIMNTLLVLFKYHLENIELKNNNFPNFFAQINELNTQFFAFTKDEELKRNAIEEIFNKLEKNLDVFNKTNSIVKIEETKECGCLALDNFGCRNKKYTRKSKINENILIGKIFMRKLFALKDSTFNFTGIDNQRYFAFKVEKIKEFWIDFILRNLNEPENVDFYRTIEDVFGSRKEFLKDKLSNHFYIVFNLIESCDIRKYEKVSKMINSIVQNDVDFKKIKFLEGIAQILRRSQIQELLKNIKAALKIKISQSTVERCVDDISCLFVANRLVVGAPTMFHEIIKSNRTVFMKNKVACYFLKNILDVDDVVLSDEKKKVVKSLAPTYSFFNDYNFLAGLNNISLY